MRIGVIRGDLPGPIFLGDVETISQYDPAIEPEGQTYNIGRPSIAEIEAALANSASGAGAVLEGADISGSYPLTINAGNQTLKLALTGTTYVTFLIPAAVYADQATLLAAVNVALANSGFTARAAVTAGAIAIEADLKGVTSYIRNDTIVGGSTANTPLGLTDGSTRTMVPAATLITDCLPVGGPLDVSPATINASGVGTATTALGLIPTSRGATLAVQNAIAPLIYDTPTAILSFQMGMIAGYQSALFNPDSHRPLPAGAAIAVVAADGVSAFTAPLTTLTTAIIGGGNLTLTGTGMGSYENKATVVKVFGAVNKTLAQAIIEKEGGTVTPTSVVIPLTLLPGLVVTTSSAQVRTGTQASAAVVVA